MANRRVNVYWAVVLLCLAGCPQASTPHGDGVDSSSNSPARAPDPTGPRVFLLRGLDDIFSLGMNALADKLNSMGIEATALSGPDWPALGDELEADYANGDRRPLVLGGHSFGADDAIRLAQYLDERGIRVQLLTLVDATDPPPIPSNVDRCVHWYIPNSLGALWPQDFSGNPVEPADGNDHTDIVNQVFTTAALGWGADGVDHLNIDESHLLHELVILEIENLEPGDSAASEAGSG